MQPSPTDADERNRSLFGAALLACLALAACFPQAIVNIIGFDGGTLATVFLVVISVALLLLGPGAFSLDARRFGRREVVIPLAKDH